MPVWSAANEREAECLTACFICGQLPWLERSFLPILVYLFLIIFLRIFGKRELAQLNPFDLVVLLSLSNTVQNAIIGNDNSVSGGLVGALALLTINWVLTRLLFKSPKLEEALEGTKTELIRNGVVDHAALKREAMSELELISVVHKQGLKDFSEVQVCALEPNGTSPPLRRRSRVWKRLTSRRCRRPWSC